MNLPEIPSIGPNPSIDDTALDLIRALAVRFRRELIEPISQTMVHKNEIID